MRALERSRTLLTVALATSALWGCGVLAGITDFNMVDADGSAPRVDAPVADADSTIDGPSAADAQSDTDAPFVIVDGGADAREAAPCQGPEVCGDGVDNDCNGFTDCADPACDTYSCLAAPPGWDVIAIVPSGNACPTGYGGAVSVHGEAEPTALPGAGVCACTCGAPLDNPCAVGTFTARFKDSPACGAGSSPLASDGGCVALPSTILAAQCAGGVCNAVGTTSLGKAVSCGAGTTTLPPLYPVNVETCTATIPRSGAAGGCSGTNTCAPPASSRCIAHTGKQACPSDFPNALPMYQGGTDTRTCGACNCTSGPVACSNAHITFFNESTCTTPVSSAVAGTGSCQVLTPGIDGGTAGYFQYSGSPVTTPTCSPDVATPAIGGGVFAGSDITVCCPP